MSAFWKERDRMFLSSSFCRPPSQAPTAAQLLGLRQCSVHTAIAGTIWLSLSPLCQNGTKEKSWAEKNLRGKSEEVCVVKKRNVNPVCLKSHLALPRARVNHPVLIFLEVCHTLTWACLYSLIPSCAPPPIPFSIDVLCNPEDCSLDQKFQAHQFSLLYALGDEVRLFKSFLFNVKLSNSGTLWLFKN